jgi:membrane-associated PAP2 superfamily phosphatase
VPATALLVVLSIIEILGLDRPIAHALFFDSASNQWLGSGKNLWWARGAIHQGGRWFVRLVAAAALVCWIASYFVERLRPWRKHAGFAFAAMAVSISLVGGLKAITNVDCPWDLTEFGGSRPYVALFADRPDSLPSAKCFPGAHSSSGFALIVGFFLLRDRSRRAAAWALLGGLSIGLIFSFGQEARGAHFVSHDLTSAGIVWFMQLLLYVWILAPKARDLRGASESPVSR